jgi:hypothetical protein
MFNLEIPEWLVLTSGSHKDKCGVCLEECLSILSGYGKTDNPENVNPVIRALGISANDSARNDQERTTLALTLGCQKDTADVPEYVTLRLAAFVCVYCIERLSKNAHESIPQTLIAAANCLNATADYRETPTDDTKAARAAGVADAAYAADAARAAGYAGYAADAARAAGVADAAYAAGAADAAGAAGYAGYAADAARAAGVADAGYAADAARAAFTRDLLFATIEEFERLTGRTECATFSDEDWARVKVAIEGRP